MKLLVSLLVGLCATSMSVQVRAMPSSLMELRAAVLPNKPSLLGSSINTIHVNDEVTSSHSAPLSSVDTSSHSHLAHSFSTERHHHAAKGSSLVSSSLSSSSSQSSASSPVVHSKPEEHVAEAATAPLLSKVLSAREEYLKWHKQNADAIVKEEHGASILAESDVDHVQLALRVLELQTQLDMLHYEHEFHQRFNDAANPEFDRELLQTVSLLHDYEQELAVYEANYLKDSMYQEKLTEQIATLKDKGSVAAESVKDTMVLYCDKICDNALNAKLCLQTVHCT